MYASRGPGLSLTVSGRRHDSSMTSFDYFDEELFDLAYKIERHGFTMISVNTGECAAPGCTGEHVAGPTWTYSIGLLEHAHPELVVLGDARRGFELITRVFELHHDGLSLPLGRGAGAPLGDVLVNTIPVPDPCWLDTSIIAYWHAYYSAIGWPHIGGDAAVLQLVIADDAGRFRWHEGCDVDVVREQTIIEDDWSWWTPEGQATQRTKQRTQQRRRRR